MPPLSLIQSWQYRYPSLAIWPLAAWLPVRERTAPTVMTVPIGGTITAGAGEHAAASELVAISAARGSQGRRTSRDYVLAAPASPADRMTNLLIAGEAGPGCPLNYPIGSGGELAKW